MDLFEWLAHYLMHRINFLWAFHKIHHAQEEIGVASAHHFHIAEYFVFKPLIYIPLSVIGYTATQYAVYTSLILAFLAFFTHANIKFRFGIFNYLINSPNTHIWHHAKNLPKEYPYGVNFASVLNIWDVLFGYYYLPEKRKPKLGVQDNKKMPKDFIGQFIYPFREVFKNK